MGRLCYCNDVCDGDGETHAKWLDWPIFSTHGPEPWLRAAVMDSQSSNNRGMSLLLYMLSFSSGLSSHFHHQGIGFTVVNKMKFWPLREQAGTGIARFP